MGWAQHSLGLVIVYSLTGSWRIGRDKLGRSFCFGHSLGEIGRGTKSKSTDMVVHVTPAPREWKVVKAVLGGVKALSSKRGCLSLS